MDDDLGRDDALVVREWRIHELQRLRFTQKQRAELLRLIEAGEVELAEVRALVEKRGWTAEQAFLNVF
jgi:hypothetical protein